MAAGSTYTPIATTTFGSAASSYTFSSIPSTYTDLQIVIYVPTNSINNDLYMQVNSDTATNYSATWLSGNGTAASSSRNTSTNGARITALSSPQTTTPNTSIVQLMNYSNATTYKTFMNRGSNSATGIDAFICLWRSTSAINTIKIYPASGNMAIGTTMTLYGILAA